VKSFLRSFFASLLAITVVIVVIVGVIASKTSEKPEIKKGSWLVIDLYGDITEYDPPSSFMGEVIGGKGETLTRVLCNLDKARVDDRIEGVIFKMSSSNGAGRGMLEEMRAAVKKVQASGKKVYGYSDSMNRHTYYLAGACDSLFMPPTAYMNFLGFSVTTEHIKGTLDKLHINPNLHRIKDYKSAAEMITREDMSQYSRENKDWMLDEYWDLYCSALAEDRGFTEEQIIAAMDKALFPIDDAVAAGFVDSAMYWDGLVDMLKGGSEDLETVSQATYAKVKPKELGMGGKKKIAVVHAQGMIGGRNSKIDPMLGIMMGHESINAQLRKARRDKDVVAVIFRVNSGGGESLASDMMGHEVAITAEEKPVIVSMVDVAASGGYMISYRATKMIADKATVTGSIGSINAKFNMKGFYDMLGITHDFAAKGPRAMMYSDFSDFTPEERQIFEKDHWKGFNAWLQDVADHRGMTFEEAGKLAMGRVWTGRQGVENGLIDGTGGLDRAIEMARELAEVKEDEKVSIVHYPQPQSFIESLMAGGGFSTAARYVVWRFVHEDVSETWDMVTSRRMNMMPEMEIR
jgi:protease-4